MNAGIGGEWMKVLKREADRSGRARTADKIGYSESVVSAVLVGSYNGDLTAVQKAVEGAFMGRTVDCPELGELAANRCIEHQRRPFAATSEIRVRLFKACRSGCPNSRLTREERL
ncbi:MAG TPA: hypothetical protein VMV27_02035 [Candidatus Binataceae bacterium]|nr:hypothetical protein [Candidatus Binataceae bacterium]